MMQPQLSLGTPFRFGCQLEISRAVPDYLTDEYSRTVQQLLDLQSALATATVGARGATANTNRGRNGPAAASDRLTGHAAWTGQRNSYSTQQTTRALQAAQQQGQPGRGEAICRICGDIYTSQFKISGKRAVCGSCRAEEECTPGPGAYDIRSTEHGPAFSIAGGRPRSATSPGRGDDVPGPGEYSAAGSPRTGHSGPSFTMAPRLERSRSGAASASSEGPGPGEHQHAALLSSFKGPAFSIATRHADRAGALDGPGPGAYAAPDTSPRGPSYTIAARHAPATPAPSSPGPGSYTRNDTAPDRPAYSFFFKRPKTVPRVASGSASSPAPGDYEAGSSSFRAGGPAWSIGARVEPRSTVYIASPGPGEYWTEHSGLAGPAFSMGTAAGGSSSPGAAADADIPGPGTYYKPSKLEGPSYTLGGRPKEKPAGDDAPGPGAYAATAAAAGGVGAGPAFTIAGKPADAAARGSASPGPGHYSVDAAAVTEVGPAFTIGSRPAEGTAVLAGPAPGQYEPDTAAVKPAAPAWTMGARAAKKLDQPTPTPAPGDFDLPGDVWLDGPAFTIPAAPVRQERQPDSPGPGEYAAAETRPHGPAFTMPGKPRPIKADAADAPGPGEYSSGAAAAAIGTGAPAFTIGARPEGDAATKSAPQPGPGQYDLERPASTGPAYTMRSSRPVAKEVTAGAPGPGAYNLDAAVGMDAGPAFTIGSRPAEATAASAGPAPGQYAPNATAVKPAAPAWTMGARAAKKLDQPTPTPAPGDFDLPGDVWLDGPAFTIPAAPVRQERQADSPGPGEYATADTRPRGPAYTILGKPRPPKADATDAPGPGEYSSDAAAVAVGPAAPAYTIGARIEADATAKAAQQPGPGQYDVSLSRLEGPAYSIGSKAAAPGGTAAEVPGPGTYELASMEPTGPAYSIGARLPAGAELAASSPGPGRYSPPPADPGPTFTMGQKVAATSKPSNVPAPGDYDVTPAGPAGPAFTLAGKHPAAPEGDGLLSPGPGEYHKPGAPAGPAFTLGARPKQVKRRALRNKGRIGPGPADTHAPLPKSGPAFTMGPKLAAAGPSTHSTVSIGPGDYFMGNAPLPAGPAFTLRPKPPVSKPDKTPGPGAYNDMRLFPRPLGDVVSSLMPASYSQGHGSEGGTASRELPGLAATIRRARRVSFSESTNFKGS